MHPNRSSLLVLVLALWASTSAGGCSSGNGDADATGGGGGAPPECSSDEDCDDELFCTGLERCDPDSQNADARGCTSKALPCSLKGQSCDESTESCITDCEVTRDADGDGVVASECGGPDCDDSDPFRYPGNVEICDADHHDEDCDSRTYGVRDQDMDGAPDASCCNRDKHGKLECGSDCDDTSAGVNPKVPEVCDGFDNNCNGQIDEGVKRSAYADRDGDGYGDATAPLEVDCGDPTGSSENGLDCDDTSADVRPGAVELCDGRDNNCDKFYERDADGDGHLDPQSVCEGDQLPKDDCNDFDPSIYPGAPELCDGYDNDCDGSRDDQVDAARACAAGGAVHAALCAQQSCSIYSCQPTYGDCNADPRDGCETSLSDSAEHCGACDSPCSLGASCVDGLCDDVQFTSVAVGDDHACAISALGRVGCWGRNTRAQLGRGDNEPATGMVDTLNLTKVAQVAAGEHHSCALTSQGDIYCWGDGSEGQLGLNDGKIRSTPTQLPLTGFDSLSSAGLGNCATKNGEAYCWGFDFNLDGRGSIPELAPFSSNVVSVTADTFLQCAALDTGKVECSGQINRFHQSGSDDGVDVCYYTQEQSDGTSRTIQLGCLSEYRIAKMSGATQVSGSCATNGSKVSCWGDFEDPASKWFDTEVALSAVSKLSGRKTSGTTFNICALNEAGQALCEAPYLGDGSAAALDLGGEVSDLSVGVNAACFVVDGGIKCAGTGAILGRTSDDTDVSIKAIDPPRKMIAFDAGTYCASFSSGDSFCGHAGENFDDARPDLRGAMQIDGDQNSRCVLFFDGSVACQTSSSLESVAIAAAREISHNGVANCAVLENGELWCWGESSGGNFGTNAPENQQDRMPTQIEGLSEIVSAALGDDFGCALDVLGKVHCWGQGDLGQLGDGRGSASLAPVAPQLGSDVVQLGVGAQFACALRLNGSVWCWGSDDVGQLGDAGSRSSALVPIQIDALSNIKGLAVGGAHACAYNSAGDLWCWGWNLKGQVGTGNIAQTSDFAEPPTRITGMQVTTVYAGSEQSCAISTNGDAFCWGRDFQNRMSGSLDGGAMGCGLVDDPDISVNFFQVCPQPVPVAGL